MRILSGIQPSGMLHIGNYFGMMKPALELQHQGEAFYFIADYHALTSVHDPEKLRKSVQNVALDFLACGLDPDKTAFYKQSDLPEVQELTWLLSIITPMGLLERCHSYKDKLAKGAPASHGLFAYPVLMAADILIVQSHMIPVGKDQKQHVEVTRDIALKFNNAFGEIFTIPEPSIRGDVAIIPGLDGQKMSKSYDNTIEIFGAEKQTKKKIMRIVTDSKGLEEAKDPETCNIFRLYKLFATDEQQQELAHTYRAGGMGYGTAKKELFQFMMDYFAPFRERRAALENNLDYVNEVLRNGAEKARSVATETLDKARQAVGLV